MIQPEQTRRDRSAPAYLGRWSVTAPALSYAPATHSRDRRDGRRSLGSGLDLEGSVSALTGSTFDVNGADRSRPGSGSAPTRRMSRRSGPSTTFTIRSSPGRARAGLLGQSSIYWQQNADQGVGGTWSWPVARQRLFDFLTLSAPAAREQALADTARALGQVMHVVQDAASPAHTREDPHPIHDGYEARIEELRASLDDTLRSRFQALLAAPSDVSVDLDLHGDGRSAGARTRGKTDRQRQIHGNRAIVCDRSPGWSGRVHEWRLRERRHDLPRVRAASPREPGAGDLRSAGRHAGCAAVFPEDDGWGRDQPLRRGGSAVRASPVPRAAGRRVRPRRQSLRGLRRSADPSRRRILGRPPELLLPKQLRLHRRREQQRPEPTSPDDQHSARPHCGDDGRDLHPVRRGPGWSAKPCRRSVDHDRAIPGSARPDRLHARTRRACLRARLSEASWATSRAP